MNITTTKDAFKIKTTSLPVLIIELYNNDITAITKKLSKNANEAPKLIQGAKVIIDLDKLESKENPDITTIAAELAQFEMTILGIKDTCNSFAEQIAASAFNAITNINANTAKTAIKERTKTKIHKGNLRSGQQIYAKDSDLIVIGSVNHSAEVAACGNIHIYGSLKGKALAGVSGDTSACIFSSIFNAQLISIAGTYKVFETLPSDIDTETPAMASLQNDKIDITNI